MLVGAVLLRLTLTGTYRRYVRPGMGPWLTVAGVALVVLGLATLALVVRRTRVADAHDHGEGGGFRAGWLLLAPIAALLLVAPPTLGSFGVGRGGTVDIRQGAPVFDPMPRRAEAVPMTLLEFDQRAFDHDGASFNTATVQLTGFVAGRDAGGFLLARYQIACCAADAVAVTVRVVGVSGDSPENDQWVTVTGAFQRGGGDVPRIAVTSVEEITPPEDPYE